MSRDTWEVSAVLFEGGHLAQRVGRVSLRSVEVVEEAVRLCERSGTLRAKGVERRARALAARTPRPEAGATVGMLDVVQRVLSSGAARSQGTAELPGAPIDAGELGGTAEPPTEAVEVGEPQGWASPLVGFHLEGLVDDRPVAAHWEEGSLTVDPVLLARARTVVGLGEAFGGDDDLPAVAAALDGSPLAAFLTLMRACSRVTRAHCGMASGG